MPLRWTVSQIGARQHYGVARGFQYQGDLRALYTDSWCRWGAFLLKHGPKRLRAFAGRRHSDLASQKVIARTVRTEWDRLSHRSRNPTVESIYLEYLRSGAVFGEWVTRELEKERWDPERDIFFSFNTGCLETLQMLGEREVFTIVDQIDPARAEENLVHQESLRWPGWQALPGRIPEAYFERLSAEWAAATLVVVNSGWSKRALMAQGVPENKLLVVPVAYEASAQKLAPRCVKKGPLTVLWLGTVNLRKGIPYLIAAARLLRRTDIRFVVAGPVEISREAIASAPPNLRFLGRLTRGETDAHYENADLFVLPTISDGFAITQVEAMARGLPVITTPNCGDVVTHGLDGLIVPAADERALAEAILKLDLDRELLREMSDQALMKADGFHLPRQAAQIERAVRHFQRARAASAQATEVAPSSR